MKYAMILARAAYVTVGVMLAYAAYWCWGFIIYLMRLTVATGGLDAYTVGKLVLAAAVTLVICAAYGLGFVRLFRKTPRAANPVGAF